MEKVKANIAIIWIMIFSISNWIVPGGNEYVSVSAQAVTKAQETKSKSAQTTTKSTQSQSKSTQSAKPQTTKPAQTTKSTQTTKKTVQTKTKTTTAASKSGQPKSVQPASKSKPAASKPAPVSKPKDASIVTIGTQKWAVANLNVSTFSNGDSIPEAKTNKEWVAAGEAGKPAWCYYNNDPANGKKYGKLYNWFAIADPRGLCPAGWSLPVDTDWSKMGTYLGGPGVAGTKIKSTSGWIDDINGTNETGFSGLPGGYRVENGTFLNLGSIGTWWSSTESSRSGNAYDYYLVLKTDLGRSSSPKQRGESVRCIRK